MPQAQQCSTSSCSDANAERGGVESRAARRLRLWVQGVSLLAFVWLLWSTVFPLAQSLVPVDIFLRLDPLLTLGLPLATRAFIPSLLPGLLTLAVCLVAGRIFCGYVCPLGATLDLWGWLLQKASFRQAGRAALGPRAEEILPRLKYLVLTALLAAAALGVNLLFWASPIPLVTRFYTVVLAPLVSLPAKAGLNVAQSSPDLLPGWASSLAYLQWEPHRYEALGFTLFLLALLLALEAVRPRFWCRFLCPSGALMSLFSLHPLWRAENRCGAPCESCRRRCPTPAAQLPSRRAFLAATGVGAVSAALHLAELPSGLATGKGLLTAPDAIRPPAALPEAQFLDRCVRCGQCMKACPSNALQPAWGGLGHAGLAGLFAPVLTPRRGACEPDCNVCGQVCPSAAIRPLPVAQKQWAKVGTALVVPGRCLAFSMDRRCVVCQEVCPYGAIDLVQIEGHTAPVPVVKSNRCFGCGYCEFHCPVRIPAIVVEAFHALRLQNDDYMTEGRAQGLDLVPGRHGSVQETELPPDALPPGFTE